jgi:gluconate 5-dehydrogenase
MSLDLFKLDGRRALVTGGASGIGLAIAGGLGRAGASVVVNGVEEAQVREAVARLKARGIDAHGVTFDVGDAAATRAAIDDIEARLGPIDVLVNNAAVQRRMPLEDVPEALWAEIMRVDLDGVFHVAQSVARHMISRRRGSIINICSINSEQGRPAIAPYTAAKGAVKMLTKGMAIDWAKHGIRANGIGPGYTSSPLTAALVADPKFTAWVEGRVPLGRWGEPEDLVGAAIFLASDAARFVTGHVLYVDGGATAVL